LGRKILANANPILGYNLHMSSRNVDEHWKYAEEEWILIEHTDGSRQGFPTLAETENSTNVSTSIETRINTPLYEMSRKNVQVNKLAEDIPNNNIEYIYYVYLMDNNAGAFIEEIPVTETIDVENLLAGPFNFIQDCQNFLIDYSTINNIKLQQKSEFEFSFVN
jgi:hypothetical protein